jgi:hypothetical protein
MKVINVSRITSKYCRRKNNYVGSSHLFLNVVENLPFGKVKIDLFLLDKYFPCHRVNYIGTDIVDGKYIEEYDEFNDYKDKNYMKYLIYRDENNNFIGITKGGDRSKWI